MEETGWQKGGHGQNVAARELSRIRERIDEIDRVTAALMTERLLLARQVADAKITLNAPVLDSARETEVVDSVCTMASDSEIAEALRSIWEAVMDQSRKIQASRCGLEKGHISERPAPDKNTAAVTSLRVPNYFPRVLIVGMGLIGGAIARQIKLSMPQTVVVGIDRPDVVAAALREGLIDGGDTRLSDRVGQASLIVLCAGPGANLRLLEEIAPGLRKRQLVIDVTSTKSEICRLADSLDLNGADFIGGHPLFGSAKSGLTNSRELSLEGKTFCLVPTSRSSDLSLRRLSRWLSALGLRVETTDATTHDAAVARLSHLVQLMTVILGAEIADGRSTDELTRMLSFSGTSFRQMARLMGSPGPLWSQIVAQNRTEVVSALKQFSTRAAVLLSALEAGNETTLEEFFKLANMVPGHLE